ncbi:MAG: type 4a pilus biogenesis protein PilO [Thermoleophilia bacterium]
MKDKGKKGKRQVPLAALLAVVIVIVGAVGYVALIRPKHAEASKLDQEIQSLESELALATRPKPDDGATAAAEPVERIRVADLVRLAKAMPAEDDMAGVLLELDAVATAAGVQFLAIQPGPATDEGLGYRRLPIQVTFDGNYYDLTEVLYDLRSRVRVRDGRLDADGRLFSLDQLDLHEGAAGFPKVEAVMTLSAYLYGSEAGDAAALANGVPSVPGTPTTPAATSIPTPTPASTDPTDTGAAPTSTEPEATATINRDPENAPSASGAGAPAGGDQ